MVAPSSDKPTVETTSSSHVHDWELVKEWYEPPDENNEIRTMFRHVRCKLCERHHVQRWKKLKDRPYTTPSLSPTPREMERHFREIDEQIAHEKYEENKNDMEWER